MKTQIIACTFFLLIPIFLLGQTDGFDVPAIEKAEQTIKKFNEIDTDLDSYFDHAYGYVVFPSIGKGASVVGGAHGNGVAFEQGNPVGKATFSQITIGIQFGGQSYSQIVFFENEEDFDLFKDNKFQFAAQVSAVALSEGAAADLAYRDGVAVFTMTKGGLMYEASVGGQKLKFKPFDKKEN